jgi:hypothetical protein
MMLLALASHAAATTWPLVTLAASSPSRDELATPPWDAFLFAIHGQGEITNWSSPLLELSSEAISS